MMPSPPIHQCSDARHSGWFSSGTAPAYCTSIIGPSRTANPVGQRPLRSFIPLPTPILPATAIGAGALIQPAQPDTAAKSP